MVRGSRGLFVLLVAGILLPGTILGVFGFRSLQQDRLLEERQTRDALQSAVEVAAREVARELAGWREWKEPGAATIELSRDGKIRSADGLLWRLGTVTEPVLGEEVERAEQAELRMNDNAAALRLYEAALRNASAGAKPAILLRIARTAKKSGNTAKAVASWKLLLTLPESPPTAAARLALVESGAASALDLYRDLIAGRFSLPRESYRFYSARVREMAGESAIAPLRRLEERRFALTEAVEAFLAAPRRRPAPGYFAFWDVERVTVVENDMLHDHLNRTAQAGLDAAIALRPRGSPAAELSALRSLDDPELPWQIAATPRDPAALLRSLQNRQMLYFGSLAVVFAVLLSGVILTARLVRREVEFSQVQSDFVATVSHEFRSPVTAIRQLGELLDSGVVQREERRREYYGLIVKESDRLARLVENLLDFSRLEAGRKQYRMEAIDTSRWLEDTAATARNPRLLADIPAGLPILRGDRDALASAVANLMDNALKYSPSESPVELAARTRDGKLFISVTDRGPGIAAEEQSQIFERFYRGAGDLPRQVKGTGIGLSLVKRIVEDHGGRVSLASRPGEGSTFIIEVNAAEEAMP